MTRNIGIGWLTFLNVRSPRLSSTNCVRTRSAVDGPTMISPPCADPAKRAARFVVGPLAVHIGVNSGLATVGATKIEGANGTRWTYTASGQVTIVAARLAALAQGDEILVGAGTRERLGDQFSFEALGERPLRNVETPVRLFRLALPQPVPATATA